MPPPPWRKIAIGAAVALVIAGAAAALIVPEIEEGKDERAARERQRDLAYQRAKARKLARETRTHRASGTRPSGPLSPSRERRARRRLVRDVEAAITRDARARVRRGNLDGPIVRTECRIYPPSRRPLQRDLTVKRMDYECVAIKAHDPGGRFIVGHSFHATVDYRRYRFTWAKVCLPPGEGSARPTC